MKKSIIILIIMSLTISSIAVAETVSTTYLDRDSHKDHSHSKYRDLEITVHDKTIEDKRSQWGWGIGDELEICGDSEGSDPCGFFADEVRIDTEYDLERNEGLILYKVNHKSKDLPIIGSVFKYLWPGTWFGK